MTELKIGSTLQNGKYEITKVLGSGNFGITYLATTKISVNGQLGQMDVAVNVAIKEFYMKDLNNRTSDCSTVEGTQNTMVKNYRKKFKKEAENLAKLHHPNIVKVIEVFDENNTTYYVMEYIEGGSLDDYIKSKGHLTENEALNCTLEIGKALSYMHENRMIHLDLKPKNIMRDKKGHLYLIDFGLSKQYDENGEPESSTSIGLGTPGYAPLEQSNYKQDGTLPVTLDVYALGASLFKMLTGKTPPEASSILNEGLPLMVLNQIGISADTVSIVEKAMSPMKKGRYQTVSSLSEAIENITSDGEQTSYPDEAERTVYEEEVEVMSEDAHADSPVNKNDITDNNEKVLNSKIGKKRIGIIVGLGFLVLLLLCTISNIPLEIRNIVGYRTGDAEDFLIKNWNTGIFSLCLSIICLIYYVFSKKKVAAYIAFICILLSVGFLWYFISSEQVSSVSNHETNIPVKPQSQQKTKQEILLEIENNMVYVEGGTFRMGATKEQDTDGWIDDDSKPVHKVTLSSYKISKYEVTRQEWDAIVNDRITNDRHPIEVEKWDDVEMFVKKINEQSNHKYRLPTEAEWEFAARGGNLSKNYIYSGSNKLNEVAWTESVSVVGKKKANELGLYDMSGNVMEVCSDWLGPYSSKSQTNPKGPRNGKKHVARGGGYKNNISWLFKNSFRCLECSDPFGTHNAVVGVRLVEDI